MICHFIDALIATTTLNTAQTIADLELMIKPIIQRSAEWGLKVGIGVVSGQVFYALIVKFTKL